MVQGRLRASLSTNPLKKVLTTVVKEYQRRLVFLLACRFLLSPPLFLLPPFLLRRRTLRFTNTIGAGGLLSSEIPAASHYASVGDGGD